MSLKYDANGELFLTQLIAAKNAQIAQLKEDLETALEMIKELRTDSTALEPERAAILDREIRTGRHLLVTARALGWQDDGEGAFEFMVRRAREVAIEDCRAPGLGKQVN